MQPTDKISYANLDYQSLLFAYIQKDDIASLTELLNNIPTDVIPHVVLNHPYGFDRAPALIFAIFCGKNTELIELLLNKGSAIDATDLQGNTALHWSVYRNNLKLTQIFLKYHANPNILDTVGRTALHWSAYNGNVKITQLLLLSGANVHQLDGNNNSVLQWGIASGNSEIVKVLLDHGAKFNV